jgi:hypothetical protein
VGDCVAGRDVCAGGSAVAGLNVGVVLVLMVFVVRVKMAPGQERLDAETMSFAR